MQNFNHHMLSYMKIRKLIGINDKMQKQLRSRVNLTLMQIYNQEILQITEHQTGIWKWYKNIHNRHTKTATGKIQNICRTAIRQFLNFLKHNQPKAIKISLFFIPSDQPIQNSILSFQCVICVLIQFVQIISKTRYIVN